MTRTHLTRLLALGAGIAVIISCDAGRSTGVPQFGGIPGTGSGPGGTPGGGGNPSTGGDGRAPTVAIDTPLVVDTVLNVGNPVRVAARLRDNQSGIASVEFVGLAFRGDRDLGTDTVIERYATVRVPTATGTLRAGTAVSRDTVIRRDLFPIVPVDSTTDSLVIRVIATDHSGLADTATHRMRVVSGPRVTITSPTAGDSVIAGRRINIQFRTVDDVGVRSVTLRIRSDSTVTPRIDTTITRTYAVAAQEIPDTASVLVPATMPARTRITIAPTARDVALNPGSGTPVVVTVQESQAAPPIVRQTVPSRAEMKDTLVVEASGDGIASLGFIVRDTNGVVIAGDSVTFADPTKSSQAERFSLGLPADAQGQRVTVVSFAVDARGRRAYSVPATSTTPETNVANARADTSLIVHGLSYTLPRAGTAGDLAVDPVRGNVFISNTAHNLLEVWNNGSRAFFASGVRVGAEPWGMSMTAASRDTLLVANSGGTNISRVYIGAADPSGMSERRILTRNTIAYTLRETIDPATQRTRLQREGPFSWSDRPQYIAQSAGGRIYYSTRPTPAAPDGTLRYLDARHTSPDSRQVYQYGGASTTLGLIAVLNVDAVIVDPAPADSPLSDMLTICDHNSGTTEASQCVSTRDGYQAADSLLRIAVPQTDIVFVPQLDIATLALTDTTFVAWSGDRKWLAFGEGQANPGRIVMVNDSTESATPVFSSGIEVSDLVENASDRVFGIALDQRGRMLAAHGTRSYFGAVEFPFHLRKQGRFDSFAEGSGVAYHPLADIDPAAPGNDPNTRLAFVASANGTIDIVDAYYYVSRGRLNVRDNLYGPLRASLPLPGDPPEVVLKLYGLTQRGLVVIDVKAGDIRELR